MSVGKLLKLANLLAV